MTFRPSLPFRAGLAALTLGAALSACGGGDKVAEDVAARVEDVNNDSPITPTEKELADWSAPADSALSDRQVEAFLKVSLLQFDLVRKEAAGWHQKAQKMEERGKDDGVLAGLRNMADGMSLIGEFGNVVGGSYVRSARTLGYNPAEMEWVRERMSEVSGYLMMKPMYEAGLASAQQMRQQAEEYRKQIADGTLQGMTEADVQNLLTQADETERQARENMAAAGAVARNMEVLRRARSNVTEPMWSTVGISAGASGLFALSGLTDPADTAAVRKLDEFRKVYEDALANRVSAGMEVEAKPAEAPAS